MQPALAMILLDCATYLHFIQFRATRQAEREWRSARLAGKFVLIVSASRLGDQRVTPAWPSK